MSTLVFIAWLMLPYCNLESFTVYVDNQHGEIAQIWIEPEVHFTVEDDGTSHWITIRAMPTQVKCVMLGYDTDGDGLDDAWACPDDLIEVDMAEGAE